MSTIFESLQTRRKQLENEIKAAVESFYSDTGIVLTRIVVTGEALQCPIPERYGETDTLGISVSVDVEAIRV